MPESAERMKAGRMSNGVDVKEKNQKIGQYFPASFVYLYRTALENETDTGA
jgi:hypothetical protein